MVKKRKVIGIGGPFVDVLPAAVVAARAPTSNDNQYSPGQVWIDSSTNQQYMFMTDNTWDQGGAGLATTTVPGIVTIDLLVNGADDDSTVPTSKAVYDYGQTLVLAGANIATEVTAGIGEIATNAEAVARQVNNPGVTAFLVTPANLTAVMSSPGPIGNTLASTGAFTGLTADGTGTVTISSNAASVYDVTGAGNDLTLSSDAGRVVVNGEEAAADAVRILSAAGGLDVDVALQMSLVTSQNAADAMVLNASAGGIDITAAGAAGEDIDIVCTAGSVNITAGESAANSIVISSTIGGIDILATGAAAGEDIDISASSSINLVSTEAVSDAINIDSSGGFDLDAVGQINLRSIQSAVDSVVIESTLGGIDILASGASAGEDIDIIATGSSVNIESTENAALAVYLHANGGVTETIRLRADQGTGAASVDILSDVGGITLTAGLGTADAINLVTSNAGGGIDIDSGTAGTILDSTGAISLDAAAASNFSVSGAGIDLDLVSAAGRVVINGEEVAADAVRILSAAGGLDANVALQMNLDSSQAAAANSVRIVASAADGGMDIDAGTGGITIDSTGAFSIDGAAASNVTATGAGIDLTLSSVLGSVLVSSTEDAALAIRLHANGGTSETIQLHADQGTGVGSINLLSDVGGITLTAGLATADAINLVTSNAAGGIDVDAGTAGVIVDTTGAISLDAAAASNFTATGAFDLTVASTLGSVVVTAGEAVADAIQLTASNAAGGVTISAGTGAVNVAGNLNLTSVATKITMNGGAATDAIGILTLVAGTAVVANTNIATGDRIFFSRTAVNASTALGELTYTIINATSFTVTSMGVTTATILIGDVSSFVYIVVGQS